MNKIKNEEGAALPAALCFFAVCSLLASGILASSVPIHKAVRTVPDTKQSYLAVESAAVFLRDELTEPENTVKIKEITAEEQTNITCFYIGADGNDMDEESWTPFSGNSILDSLIQEIYCRSARHQRPKPKTFTLCPAIPDAGNLNKIDAMTVSVELSMDSEYQITAVLSVKETDYSDKVSCTRILTLPAQIEVENADEYSTYTTISWKSGMIEKER